MDPDKKLGIVGMCLKIHPTGVLLYMDAGGLKKDVGSSPSGKKRLPKIGGEEKEEFKHDRDDT